MAGIYKRPGSAGTWDSAKSVLTVNLGQTAELILWGGGGDGGKLFVGFDKTMAFTATEDRSTPVGDHERLFKAVPQEVGEFTMRAHADSISGPEYAAPAKIVVLPRQASSIGPQRVIIWSGHDNESIQEAYRKNPNASVYGLSSVDRFTELLTNYRNGGRRISALEFNTHGSAGSAWLGNTPLNSTYMSNARSRSFSAVFTAGAAIFFHGCNIAEGQMGNRFLVSVGQTLLSSGGGSVAGSTSLGFGLGSLGNGKVYHFLGRHKACHRESGWTSRRDL